MFNHCQIDLIEILDDGFHVAVDGRIARQVHAKAIGEGEHVAVRVTDVSSQTVRGQAGIF